MGAEVPSREIYDTLEDSTQENILGTFKYPPSVMLVLSFVTVEDFCDTAENSYFRRDSLTERERQRTGCSRFLARAWMFLRSFVRSLGRKKTNWERREDI